MSEHNRCKKCGAFDWERCQLGAECIHLPKPAAPACEPDWCPECGAPGNDRRDLSLGATWRQCERRECLQEWFTDINYSHRAEPKPAEPEAPAYRHKWDRSGERCEKCGDKDWMGGPCSKPDILREWWIALRPDGVADVAWRTEENGLEHTGLIHVREVKDGD